MKEWELNRQKRVEAGQVLKDLLWCLPLPFLMGLKVGIDFYILGPAYYVAAIRHKKRQVPAAVLGAVGVFLLPGSALRWKYGLLLTLFTIEEWYLQKKKPTWAYWRRCLCYVAGLLVLVLGLTMLGVLQQYQIISLFLEAVFLMGAACLYHRVLEGKPAEDELTMAGASLTVGTILAAFHWVQLGSIIPSEVLLLTLGLLAGYKQGISRGLLCTLPAAFFMRLSLTAGEGLVILELLMVILAGAFRDMGQKPAAAAGCSGGCLWVLLFMGGKNVIPGIITVAAACLAFGLFPIEAMEQLRKKQGDVRDSAGQWKRYLENELSQGAQAFQRIAELIAIPPRKLKITSQDLVYLKEDIAGTLCQECEKQRLCWGKQYARTHEAVVNVMEASRQRGKVERKDLPAAFLETCHRAADFVRTVNRHYELYRLNQSWENRMAQSARLLQGQYEAMAAYLNDMRSHFTAEVGAELEISQQFLKQLRQRGIQVRGAEVMADEREDRVWIQLEVDELLPPQELRRCEQVLTELTGRTICLQEKRSLSNAGMRYRFADPNLYRLQLGIVDWARQEVSGDSYTAQRLDEQRFVIALGDGMGSGESAHQQSQRALMLLEQLLLTGIEEEEAIGLLNTALVLTSSEEMFTTIDLALLNLHTGQLKLVKAGSCTTFLRSRAAVYVYHSQSLPVGILDDPEPETFSHQMENGDLLVMISDGVLDQLPESRQGEKWIRRYLMQTEEENPQELAEQLQQQLLPHVPRVEDDQTILVVRIEKRNR